MYTYIMKDVYGNWFLSKNTFDTEKEAEEEASFITEYDFVYSVQVVKTNSSEIKNIKTYKN